MDESTPCANKEQGFIVKSKKKRKKSKNKGASNNTLTGKEFEPEKQPKERTTLLIGDSMISRIPGKDLGKAVGHSQAFLGRYDNGHESLSQAKSRTFAQRSDFTHWD